MRIRQHDLRAYLEAMIGLDVSTSLRMVSGTVEGRYVDGGDHEGMGGSLTVNFKF